MTVTRRTHRVLGIALLLPMFGWAATGLIFFVKPGYDAAYGSLRVRTYPLDEVSMPKLHSGWLELRTLRTILGDHMLVRSESGWKHLDRATVQIRPIPSEPEIRRLIDDAITSDRGRYGEIAAVTRHEGESPAASIETTTGAKIDLDWNTLQMQQSGRDTRRIDALYRVHYLQWTGLRVLDQVLGVVGLASLVVLASLGVRLAFGARR